MNAQTTVDGILHKEVLGGLKDTIDCRVVRAREELEQAYALVYREYLKRGYTKENPSGLRFSIYNALPDTATFVAVADDKDVIATATVVPDNPVFGLPMDEIYKQELDRLRADNKRICEITMLARDSDFFMQAQPKMNSAKLYCILSSFKVLLDYIKDSLKLDVICIAINPRSRNSFSALFFKELGGLKAYRHVNNAPAIAQYIDITSLEERFSRPGRKKLYNIFMERNTPLEKFSRKMEFTQEDLEYFFIQKSQIFENASQAQLNHLKTCYPAHSF